MASRDYRCSIKLGSNSSDINFRNCNEKYKMKASFQIELLQLNYNTMYKLEVVRNDFGQFDRIFANQFEFIWRT